MKRSIQNSGERNWKGKERKEGNSKRNVLWNIREKKGKKRPE